MTSQLGYCASNAEKMHAQGGLESFQPRSLHDVITANFGVGADFGIGRYQGISSSWHPLEVDRTEVENDSNNRATDELTCAT